MIRIRMRFKRAIWTSFGREVLFITTYSDGLERPEWYIVHDSHTNRFMLTEHRKA